MDYFQSFSIQNKFKATDEIEELEINIAEVLQHLQNKKKTLTISQVTQAKMIDSQKYIETLLISGFSVLVYGYGSKIEHLQNIMRTIQNIGVPVIEFKGFHSAFNLKAFLHNVYKAALTISNEQQMPYIYNLSD